MSRTYRRNSDEHVAEIVRGDDQRKKNAREWARRAKSFADAGDYDRAEANIIASVREALGRVHQPGPPRFV